MRVDYHIHSNSPDAGQDMKEMCRAAIAGGIDEIAITDHYEFYSGAIVTRYFHRSYLDRYFEDLAECRELFAGKLTIRAGAELGQGYQDICRQQEIIAVYPFDYLIGSLHKLNNVDLSNLYYGEGNDRRIAEAYYRQLLEMTRSIDFDCLGHLDLVRRYGKRAGCEIETRPYMGMITEVLKQIIAQGKGIEINTSSLREGLDETMPGQDILTAYRNLGGKIVTVGSDAHTPAEVGRDLDAADKRLKAAGFASCAVYKQRKYRLAASETQNPRIGYDRI